MGLSREDREQERTSISIPKNKSKNSVSMHTKELQKDFYLKD